MGLVKLTLVTKAYFVCHSAYFGSAYFVILVQHTLVVTRSVQLTLVILQIKAQA